MIDIKQLIQGKYYEKFTDYSVRLCTENDIEGVRDFLRIYWKENHPFVVNTQLLHWQYYDNTEMRYNIVIAQHVQSGEIRAVYAFIPVSQFDPELRKYRDIWLSIWRTRPDKTPPLLGLSLLSYLINELQPRALIGIKSTDIAKALYGANSDFKTGMLGHFYMLNPDKQRFVLIDGFDGKYGSNEAVGAGDTRLTEIDPQDVDLAGFAHLFSTDRVPVKSATYVRNRFLMHPVFKYRLYAVTASGSVTGLFVTRIQEYNGARALRIVDYFGSESALAGIHEGLTQILKNTDCEYVDFYHHGFSDVALARAGFLKRDPSSPLVIPNHFDPFDRKNVDIDYLIRSETDVLICKADADQDRPNKITGELQSV